MRQRIAIALSGGVDSAIAAYLLRKQGYEVLALTMLLYNENIDATTIAAQKLELEHHIIDLRLEFSDLVIKYFLNEYKNGRTPNPCCVCNRYIKFGLLQQHAQKLGASKLATGHYARLIEKDGFFNLWRGCDTKKDQSYFLGSLTQEMLSYSLFPLGGLNKPEVKKLAFELDMTPVQKESQDICFIKDDYRDFIKDKIVMQSGLVLDEQGQKLGTHQGLPLYTVGQRHGLNIASSKRLYVKNLNAADNTITLAPFSSLLNHTVKAKNVSWLKGQKPSNLNVTVQIRYQAKAQEAKLLFNEDGTVTAVFVNPVCAATAGQYMVFYDGDEVLGSAII